MCLRVVCPGWFPAVRIESPQLDQKLSTREIGGASLEGCMYSNHYHSDDPAPEIRDFVQRYEKRYGAKPDSIAALAYDSARVLADAIRRAPTLDRRAIRDALTATRDFHGVTGTITFGADRNPIGKKVVIEKVQGGKLLLQKTITPSPSRQPQDAPA